MTTLKDSGTCDADPAKVTNCNCDNTPAPWDICSSMANEYNSDYIPCSRLSDCTNDGVTPTAGPAPSTAMCIDTPTSNLKNIFSSFLAYS